jgi:hypothetical protein
MDSCANRELRMKQVATPYVSRPDGRGSTWCRQDQLEARRYRVPFGVAQPYSKGVGGRALDCDENLLSKAAPDNSEAVSSYVP